LQEKPRKPSAGTGDVQPRQQSSAFENEVLKISGSWKGKGYGRWRKLHNEELHNLYSSPNTIRVIT
jgi:hypothetical protein